jgi:endonuclease/exonuclease/phosphatase family metal-dependent hydrolase
MGDFNARPDEPSLAPLRDAGFVALAGAEHLASGSPRRSYVAGRRGGLIDYLFVRPAKTAEWVSRSTHVYDPGRDVKAFVDHYSDHVPVWASFETHRDDDP